MKEIIKLKKLSYSYKNKNALKNISLNIKNEKFITILGPNGSGKTTLLKILAGILKTQSDTVYFFNKDINKYPIKDFSKIISYVPQFINLPFDIDIIDFMLLGKQKIKEKDLSEIKKYLKLTKSEYPENRNINSLSGGEKQKIFIAKALSMNTPVILFDEPNSHLDIANQIEILDILKNESRNGKIVITALHDINMAAMYSDYVVILKNSEVFASGIPEMTITKEIITKCYNVDIKKINRSLINL